MVFFSMFFLYLLSDFVDSTMLSFGGTELLRLTQTKVYAAARLWQWTHIDHTPGFLKSNAKCKTPAEFNIQRFEKQN